MSEVKARTITSLIRDHNARDVLELGFRFGVSTTYIAGALQDMGGGHITTIDLATARDGDGPNLECSWMQPICGPS